MGKRELTEDMESWGASPDVISEAIGEDDPELEPFGVYRENWIAVGFFLGLQTQWVVTGFGERTGLNYSGVEVAARLKGVELTSDLFQQIQIMEMSALKEMKNHVSE